MTPDVPGRSVAPGFVIFDSGSVKLAPFDDRTPVPLRVEDLAAILGSRRVPTGTATKRWPPGVAFELIGPLVARFDGAVLHAPSPAPASEQLDAEEVRVLARPPGTLFDDLSTAEALAAERLVTLGLVVPATADMGREEGPSANGPAPASGLANRTPPSTATPSATDASIAADPPVDLLAALPQPRPRAADDRWRLRRRRRLRRRPVEPGLPPLGCTPVAGEQPVRVFSIFGADGVDPSLALGFIVAFARAHRGGTLHRTYDLRPPTTDPNSLLVELGADPTGAIVLFADYSWTTAANLETSRQLRRLSPDSIIIHGGPHIPRHPDARDDFLAEHPEVDVVVRFEGEETVAEILDVLGGAIGPHSLDSLAGIAGTSVRTTSGLVHAPDRPRIAQLDRLPSPYLTGEYDSIDLAHWNIATIETDRGCPFRCAFCDWGSATGTKPRQFDVARVRAEIEWIGSRGIAMLFIADANFGGSERDVEIAEWIADVRARHGAPHTVIASFAKNTTEHIVAIVDIWRRAGIAADGLTAIQTVDPVSLKNVRRQNIGVEAHDALTETFRERGLPLLTDLLIGLPGATVETFKTDLQRCIDLEVTPRIAEVEVLPNSPMNAPAYRQEMGIVVGSKQTIIATYSATEADIEEMLRLRILFRGLEHFGLARHVLRYAQHEHGIRAVDLIHDVDRAVNADPRRWPGLTWVARYLDLYTVPPMDWRSWTDELAAFLAERHGIDRSPGLGTVLAVQQAVLPSYGRRFPEHVVLDHDYAAWYRELARPGAEKRARRGLEDYGPGLLVISDPADICRTAIGRNEFITRRDQVAENLFWMVRHWELASEVARPLAATAGFDGPTQI